LDHGVHYLYHSQQEMTTGNIMLIKLTQTIPTMFKTATIWSLQILNITPTCKKLNLSNKNQILSWYKPHWQNKSYMLFGVQHSEWHHRGEFIHSPHLISLHII